MIRGGCWWPTCAWDGCAQGHHRHGCPGDPWEPHAGDALMRHPPRNAKHEDIIGVTLEVQGGDNIQAPDIDFWSTSPWRGVRVTFGTCICSPALEADRPANTDARMDLLGSFDVLSSITTGTSCRSGCAVQAGGLDIRYALPRCPMRRNPFVFHCAHAAASDWFAASAGTPCRARSARACPWRRRVGLQQRAIVVRGRLARRRAPAGEPLPRVRSDRALSLAGQIIRVSDA